MWRKAETKAQKQAIIDRLIPMTADSYLDALIHFLGDDETEIRSQALEKLRSVEPVKIAGRISADTEKNSFKFLLKLLSENPHPALSNALFSFGTIDPAWISDSLLVENETLWRELIHNRDFVTLSNSVSAEITKFLEGFSSSLKTAYIEQLGYVEIPVAKEIREEEEISFEEEVELDLPDFMIAEEPFEGLDPEEIQEEKKNITEIIRNMSMAQKVKAALMGNQEVRKILIKDPRKQVAMAVLSNPRVTENELTALAGSTSVSEEVIAHIANSKELTKGYQTKLSLVLNPKTPLRVAMRFLSVLRLPDLRKVAKSKSIPSTLRNVAKQKMR